LRILIAPYTRDLVPAVRQFNQRLAGSPFAEFTFPEEPVEGAFLAVEGEAMRGGYILHRQRFSFAGEIRSIAHYQLPVSEGVLDRAYAGVGMQLLRSALKTEPLLFGLGMGGVERPLPRMLKAMGWSLCAVPFAFKALHPARFLRHIQPLRATPARKAAAEIARATGAGWAALCLLQAWAGRRGCADCEAEPAEGFGAWADEIWERAKDRYAMVAVRDCAALEALYPRASGRFLRLKITRQGQAIGWAVGLDTAMRGHRQFGDLRVGTIADTLAAPEDAAAVTRAAAALLASRGVDLVISNQAHRSWDAALGEAGFLRGPSDFAFAASPKLAELLAPFAERSRKVHINRGDGDGPIHL
jgi:hypothetical protein